MARILPRSFYVRPAIEVARGLLGKVVRYGDRSAIIVETEAYLGEGDLAAHSARGITKRTQVIFGPPGHLYVYMIYGMHYCTNIVAEKKGQAGCVLLRALEPVTGIGVSCSGPGRLTRALGLTARDTGLDVTKGPLLICEPALPNDVAVHTSPRIGISKSVDLPLRFFIAGNRHVSGNRLV